MARFLGGFAAASVLWGAFLYAHLTGIIDINLDARRESPDGGVAEDAKGADSAHAATRTRHGRGRRARRFAGDALAGDDLGGPDTRHLDTEAAGGEQQLRGDEIERQFDTALPQIRRCLILAASEEPVTGKVVFGLRIAGGAGVTKVNLRGPGAITQTEAGDCMRKAALGMRFRTFDGPDMLVQFPMTLE